ncbi:hypothetical protein [Nocardia nepalensis]|uniref:hypothetical protein n=1 Tax=Nocardia nepalensis TaxID=3375448 RepID=UPI003B67E239
MTVTHEAADSARQASNDASANPSDPRVVVERNAPPFVRAVATRARLALRTDHGCRAFEALAGTITLRSAIDVQGAQVRRTPEGLEIGSPAEPACGTITVNPVSFDVVDSDLEPDARAIAVTLIDPEPLSFALAAQQFQELSADLPGMPGVRMSAVDTGAVATLGLAADPYEIFGLEQDLRRVLSGMDWFPHSLQAGRFAIRGSLRQLSVLIGASMKAVYGV